MYADLCSFDILAFTETWLDNSTSTSDIAFANYQIPFRKDRPTDRHGGVIVYVKDTLSARRRPDLEINDLECIWLELNVKRKSILFGVFYRPPNSTAAILSGIEDSIALAIDTGIKDIVVTGDFNFDYLKPTSRTKIDNICMQFGLSQLITEPTNFTESSQSVIDLFFTSSPNLVSVSGVGEPFLDQAIRYHCPVFCCLKYPKPLHSSFKRKVWKFAEANFDLLRQKVSDFNWQSCFDPDIDAYASNFSSSLLSFCDECIPNKTVTIRPTDPPWMHNTIRKYIRKRRRAYIRACKTQDPNHWSTYNTIRNKTNSLVRKAKLTHTTKMADLLKTKLSQHHSSDYWKLLKGFTNPSSTSSSIPTLHHNNKTYDSNLEKANVLNTFFQTQTLLDDSSKNLPNTPINDNTPKLSHINIQTQEVKDTLKILKSGKATGPDTINNIVLKELSHELSQPLCDLFNYSLNQSKVPRQWKLAHVCAIYKKKDPHDVSNYRPISLLSAVSKVLERIIHKHIFNFFLDNNFISSFQSGFVPKDSTVNQLTYIYHTFCKALDDGKEVRAIFCDISKAFDRVWHKGLLFKLQRSGISASLLLWFENYLSDRSQRVVISGSSSDTVPILAGVPQGSILGPLLFLVYINDIVSDIDSSIRLFADDTTLYVIVDNPQHAAHRLNSDLQTINNWASTWLVSFNPDKTESLLISRKQNKRNHPPVFMNNTQIQEVDSHKHLGITLSNDCTWHSHIQDITKKAWTRINILRSLKFILDRKSLETIYKTFIRPTIEYSDVVWDNITQAEEEDLEKIQTEAARIITGATRLVSLHNLYKESGLEPLKSRRRQHKLVHFYKMLNSSSTPSYLTNLIPVSVGTAATYGLRNSDHIRNVPFKTRQFSASFLPSTISEWNKLPSTIRSVGSVLSFKHALNANTKSVPKFYFSGKREPAIQHARLRMHCSSLNEHLFSKNIVESPLCTCGAIEDTYHFLIACPLYDRQRDLLIASLNPSFQFDVNQLLFGNEALSDETNNQLFDHVQTYISNTKRFVNKT